MRKSSTNFRESKEEMLKAITLFEASLSGMSLRRIAAAFGLSVSQVVLRVETVRRLVDRKIPADVKLPPRWQEAVRTHQKDIRCALALVWMGINDGSGAPSVERKSDREEYPYMLYDPNPDSGVPMPFFKTWGEALTAQKAANAERPGHKALRRP